MTVQSFLTNPTQYVANRMGETIGDMFGSPSSGSSGPSIVDQAIMNSLQASFDTKVLSGEMSEQDWYAMISRTYPEYLDMANRILSDFRNATRGTYTQPGMTRPDASGAASSGGYTPSLLESPDAAFIAAAVAVLGIALLIMRTK